MYNGDISTHTEERIPQNNRTVLPRQLYAKSLRQRRPSPVLALVFKRDSKTAHEIRNGKHTKEFYIRYGLLPVASESQ